MYPDILAEDAYGFLLVFTRIGAVLMFIPALGSKAIPARFRLTMALALSFITFLIMQDRLPAMPTQYLQLGVIVVIEVTKGILIAMVARFMLAALHVAGTIIGFQGGLAAAQQFDPNQGQQGATLSAFFTFLGVMIIFIWNLHHVMIEAMISSYILLPAAAPIVWADFAEVIANTLAGAFQLGVQLASPFIVYALVYNISLGLVARLMPQLPVFFVGMPINLFIGLFLLSLLVSAMMMWFAQYFEDQYTTIFL